MREKYHELPLLSTLRYPCQGARVQHVRMQKDTAKGDADKCAGPESWRRTRLSGTHLSTIRFIL